MAAKEEAEKPLDEGELQSLVGAGEGGGGGAKAGGVKLKAEMTLLNGCTVIVGCIIGIRYRQTDGYRMPSCPKPRLGFNRNFYFRARCL